MHTVNLPEQVQRQQIHLTTELYYYFPGGYFIKSSLGKIETYRCPIQVVRWCIPGANIRNLTWHEDNAPSCINHPRLSLVSHIQWVRGARGRGVVKGSSACFTHLFLESVISIVRQLSWRIGLSDGLTVYNVMGNLVDKEAVSFINSDLSIPRPPSAPQSPSPRASRKPTSRSSDKNCW